MYLTNQQLITERKDGWGDLSQLAEQVSVIFSLVKKYGSSSLKGSLFWEIKKADSSLAEVILLLDVMWKLNKKSLWALNHELWGWNSEWYVVRSSNPDTVEWAIQPSADKVSSKKIEVQISWDWKIYKRGLDRDLWKMLS